MSIVLWVLLVLLGMFGIFSAGKFIAYAPEIGEWLQHNWPDMRL